MESEVVEQYFIYFFFQTLFDYLVLIVALFGSGGCHVSLFFRYSDWRVIVGCLGLIMRGSGLLQ